MSILPHKTKCDPEAQAPEAPQKRLSKGEKAFDWLTYGGLAGVGTFLLTVPVTYALKYGKGAKYYEKAAEWLTKKGMSHKGAEELLLPTALMQGGNLMLFPVRGMESNKVEIVSSLNNSMGQPDVSEDIKREAEQTWGSILKSRIVAWLTVFTAFKVTGKLIPEKMAKFEAGFAEKMCKWLGKATHTVDPVTLAKTESKAFRYGRITSGDVFATAASATLLYVASRFFAEPDKDFPCDPKDKHGNSVNREEPVLFAPEMTEPITQSEEKSPANFTTTSRSILSRATAPKATVSDAVIARKAVKTSMAIAD